MKRLVLGMVAMCVLGLGVGRGTPAWAAAKVGDPLPELKLPSVETEEVLSAGDLLAGKVGAVCYMQTSCAACRKELLALKDLAAKYPKFGVVVVSVDAGSPARVQRYREHFGFDFPFLHDPEFKTPELFGFSFTPALVLVDPSGKIALLKGGYRPGDEAGIEAKIQELLKR